jgi:hypothetical protein
MSQDLDIASEIWASCKNHIPENELSNAAADAVVVLIDILGCEAEDIKNSGFGQDKEIKVALKGFLTALEEESEIDEEDDTDLYDDE